MLFRSQAVEEGALLYEIDPRPYRIAVEKATADLAIVEADLKNAHDKVERNRPLVPVLAISRQDFDQLVADERSLQATLAARQATLEQAKLDLSFTRITSPVAGQASSSRADPGTYVTSQVKLTNLMQLLMIFLRPAEVYAVIEAMRLNTIEISNRG